MLHRKLLDCNERAPARSRLLQRGSVSAAIFARETVGSAGSVWFRIAEGGDASIAVATGVARADRTLARIGGITARAK